jgi:hypothetical protein
VARPVPNLVVYHERDLHRAGLIASRFAREYPTGHVGQRHCVIYTYNDCAALAVWRTRAGSVVVYSNGG